MSPTLFITVGIPGCGKTPHVRRFKDTSNAVIVSPDSIRREICGRASDHSKDDHVWWLAYVRCQKALEEGRNVIFDSTGLQIQTRQELSKIADHTGALKLALRFDVPVEVAHARNLERARPVPAGVIDRMANTFRETSSIQQLQSEGWTTLTIG